MKNYKMILQYEGARYQGWQRQVSTENTIQGKLEAILARLYGRKVEVQGAGRTDAGVHAYGQTANFHAKAGKTEREIMAYLNQYLPEDIAVISLTEVPERFHSRLNARGKVYRYRVLNSAVPHVFDRRYVYGVTEPLDIKAMEEAAGLLCGTHDFKAFTSAKRGKKTTVRTIKEIKVERAGDEIQFTFTGDGFLHHMVRIMAGTLIEVGLGERRAEEISGVLASMNRENAGKLVPGRGLALMRVDY